MIAYLLVFCYYPMYGVTLAFKEFNFSKGILGSPWAKEYGFYNFMRLFRDPSFITAFTNTLLISAGRLIFEFPVPIVLSLLINEIRSTKYKRVVQTIYTFPHFISWIIVAGLFFNLFSNDGIVNQFLLLLGLERQTIAALSGSDDDVNGNPPSQNYQSSADAYPVYHRYAEPDYTIFKERDPSEWLSGNRADFRRIQSHDWGNQGTYSSASPDNVHLI